MEPTEHEQSKHVSSDQRYLERLEFNPELRKSWLNFFVTNFRVVVLMIILLSAAGLYAFFKLPRESNPEVKIPIAVVNTLYPGASPADVEELVTKKVETEISSIKGIDKITSTSANSFSSIVVEFSAKEDLEDSIRRLRDKVSGVKPKLPDDAKDPAVMEISLDDQPIWTAVLTGPYDGFAMRKYAEDVKDELEKIPGIREVEISGGDEKELEIAYNPEKLLFYNLSADQVSQLVAATNLAIPAGNFEGSKFVYPIRTDAKVFTVNEMGGIPVSHTPDGGVVYLRDLATIRERAIKKSTLSRLSMDGSKPLSAVTLSVVKRTGSSILDTVDSAKETMDRQMKLMPAGVKYDVTMDMAKFVRQDFDQLTHDFILTLLLVFGILFVIVGLKEAFVAGLAIPLVFFASFLSLYLLDMSLNFLSMFSLILALGLLVDDAIVVVSATKQYLKTGKFTPEQAVLLVLNDFKVVLTTTTLTTVWAFLPLLFSTGIMGEYIKSIPVTVSITLIASLLIALMINHPLAAVLERIRLTRGVFYFYEIVLIAIAGIGFVAGGVLGFAFGILATLGVAAMIWWYEKGGKESLVQNAAQVEREWGDDELIKKKLREQGSHKDSDLVSRLMHGIVHFDRLLPIYDKYVRMVLATKKSRMVTLGAVFAAFVVAVAMPATGIVKSEFFPPSDMDYVYVDVRTPVGQRLEETDKVVQQVEERLRKYPEISNYSTIVGHTSALSGSSSSGTNVGSVTITLKDKEERDLTADEIATAIRKDVSDIDGGKITVATPSNGPPAGSAFEARIKGDDLVTLDRIAHELEPKLTAIPGVINTDISLKDSAPEYTFELDPVKLEQNALNAAFVGSTLRMAISGTEVSTVIRDGKEVKIMARFGEGDIPTLEAVQNLQITNLRRQPVFLKDVAKIELKPSVDSITRIDQKRTVLLSAGATAQTNSNLILAEFKKNTRDYQFPSGYSIVYGGQNEQNTESVMSILMAMAVAMLLIVSTLIIQFNSFRKAFIVLVTIPLALIGVFLGMAILDVHLSFPGLIGVLALFGIVVKNAIILVDKMNLNIESGIPFFESVVDAGKSRLEAIFITSICTIFGILPVTMSNELWRSLGSAVIFGLTLSSFLTLFIVPTLYVSFVGEKHHLEPQRLEV